MDSVLLDRKVVLLVENDIYVLKRTEAQLRILGVKRVLTATTLADARAWLATEKINLGLLDVKLEHEVTTLALGRSLEAAGVPVVFFSGYNYEDMARATRGFELLEKPVSLPRLKAAMLRSVLSQPSCGDFDVAKKMAGPETRQFG